MHTTATEERTALVEAVRDFATTALAPYAGAWDAEKHFPVDTLRQAGDLGLGGVYASEDVGGSALSRMDAVAIFEELAKGDTTIAAYISIHNMVVWMIDTFGDAAQRARWLPRLTRMEDLGSYCLTEPGAGSDAAAITTAARREGDEYVIDGVKQF
ncbi:MAG: acyl-CoA dehydrogenase family protein, partial [Microbacterium sp.]|nr:acyl-CoA dehydrogenase family protein [Microbacterium sp.]